MDKGRKESRLFQISVEGINCEKLYFEHLASLINKSGSNKYNVKVNCRKLSPKSFAKRNAHMAEERRGGKSLPYLHIQDIEDYGDELQRQKFYALLDEIKDTESEFGIRYKLGYSNYTFELWMLLHVADMNYAVSDRYAYLKPINRYFGRNYASLDAFKSRDEFQGILNEFVTLDSIRAAVKRAEKIAVQNASDGKAQENYKGFRFFRENPDVTVHEIVKIIFEVCGVT